MPPKKDQQPVASVASLAAGLISPDLSQQCSSLTQLSGPAFTTAQAHAEVVEHGIPEKLVQLLQQPDKSLKLLACRQIAAYAAAGADSPAQQALASTETVQALWSVLQAYQAAQGAIAIALADPAAGKAAAPKKPQGPKEPVDPDEWLPGPSKYLLEAALRALSSLAVAEYAPPAQQGQLPAAADVDGSQAGTATQHQQDGDGGSSNALCSYICQQEAPVHVCLLQHLSGKVQMRGARLAMQLADSCAWCEAFTAAGGVNAAMHAAGLLPGSTGSGSNTAVQIASLNLLCTMADRSRVAVAAMTLDKRQMLEVLMQQLLAAGTAPAVHAAGSGGKAKALPDANKLAAAAREQAVPVQQAVADLLTLLCLRSSQTCQLLTHEGGLQALQALLPDPPAGSFVCVEQQEQQPSFSGGCGSSQSIPAAGADVNGDGSTDSSRGLVPLLSLTPDRVGPVAADAKPLQSPKQETPRTPTFASTGVDHNTSDRPSGPMFAAMADHANPAAKVLNPLLQAKLLWVIEAMLSQPGTVAAVLPTSPQLLRQLLHLFAADPSTMAARATCSSSSDSNVQCVLVGSAGTGASLSGSGAGKGAATMGGGKSDGLTPRCNSVARGALAVPAQADAGGQNASNGGATPRKLQASAVGKASDTPTTAVAADTAGPPYAACTKAAALACLRHFSCDKHGTPLLAAQQMYLPALGSNTEPAQTSPNAPEQHQHDAGVSPAASMLQQVLWDLQQLGSSITGSSNGSTSYSGTASAEPSLSSMLDEAADFLAGLAENLDKQHLQELPMLETLQALARCSKSGEGSLQVQHAVSRALLLLPEEAFMPPPRPPLPSPPPTPPPPPLPTSQFAWDALGRPCITDGAVLVSDINA